MHLFVESFVHSIKITIFVLLMMIFVELLNILTKNRAKGFIRTRKKFQYGISALLGAIPGCFGSFLSVSFYVHGMISFGAIVATMIATSGDEAFVMLVRFPKTALILFGLLFVAGIIFGYLAEVLIRVLKIEPCQECRLSVYHEKEEKFSFAHFIKEHIYEHILKKHTLSLFLWIFGTLFIVNLLNTQIDIQNFISNNKFLVLLISAIVGILPESGPNLIFVNLFAQGSLPFSILFTNSFVQDGHGLLPLLSYSIKDSILVKIFNLVFGLGVGYLIMLLGF